MIEPNYEGTLANLVSLVDCASWLALENLQRVSRPEGDVYEMSVKFGDQLVALLIMGRDAARQTIAEAVR